MSEYDDKQVKPNGLTEREETQLPRRRAVIGYEGAYEVDDQGNVYSLSRIIGTGKTARTMSGRVLTPTPSDAGHMYVTLSFKGVTRRFYVHRLVLEAFVGPASEGTECRHLNGNPADNRLENLIWGSRSENIRDRQSHGVKLNQNQGKTHCIRGHEYTPENTYISRGFRSCKTCKREAKLSV